MRARIALAAACLAALAASSGWAAAQLPRALSSSTATPGTQKLDVGMAQRKTEVQRLQRAVSAEEAKREEAQRRLLQQDEEIQSLRRQLETASDHDSVKPY